MNGDKQVGFHVARQIAALFERDKIITAASELSGKTRLCVDRCNQFFGDCERNFFFAQTIGAQCAGIFTAVSSIHSNHNKTLAAKIGADSGGWCGCADNGLILCRGGFGNGYGFVGGYWCINRCWCSNCGGVCRSRFIVQVDDQTIMHTRMRFKRKTVWRNPGF